MLYGFNTAIMMIGTIYWSQNGFWNFFIKMMMGMLALVNGAVFVEWVDRTYPSIRAFMGL